METLQISLPTSLKEFIDAEVTSGSYGSPSDLIQELVRTAQRCKAQEDLEAQLLEGLRGPSREVTPEWWEAFHERMRQRHATKAASPVDDGIEIVRVLHASRNIEAIFAEGNK